MNFLRVLSATVIASALVACGGQSSNETPSSSVSSSGLSSSSAANSASSSSSVSSSAPSSASSSAAAPSASPASMRTDRWYVLTNSANGLALDIEGISTEAGAALTQWTRLDGQNQQFRFVDSGNNYYRMIARHSGLALDVYEFNENEGADLVQWEDLNGENQQFQVLSVQNGDYQILNRMSNKVLAPENYASDPGTRITQYDRNGAQAQQWQLVDLEAYEPSTSGGPTGECGAGNPKALITGSPGNYQMNGRNFGNDFTGAIWAAFDELTPGRTQQERITIMASGDVGDARINLKSNTIFEVCGTLNASPASRGTITIWGSQTENISIPYLKMTGTTSFAMLIADTRNLHLGQIDLRLNGGGGIRFDNRGATYDVKIDDVYVEGTSGHGVETWKIDGLEIGSVVARNTGSAGLLLNDTRNATVGLVDGQGTGTGTGYATLRFANTNGRINNAYPTNIYVDKVISRGGARGIFCVSNSGGVEINSIDLASNGNNSILIENCHNVKINGGTINGGGEVRISARSEFPNTSDVTISNLSVSNTSVRESPCGDNINWVNLSVTGGSRNTCD